VLGYRVDDGFVTNISGVIFNNVVVLFAQKIYDELCFPGAGVAVDIYSSF